VEGRKRSLNNADRNCRKVGRALNETFH
jgi:hypothetical protein